MHNVKQIKKTPTQDAGSTGIFQTKKDNEKIVIPSIALQAHALQIKVRCAIFEYVPHNTSTRQIGIYSCEDNSL